MAGWRRAGILWLVMLCLGEEKVDRLKCPVEFMMTVSGVGRVNISCPPIVAGTEMKFFLLLNFSYIYEADPAKDSESDSAGILFLKESSPALFLVQTNSSGLYSCKRETRYPPPHRDDCITTAVWMAEKQDVPVVNQSVLPANQSSPAESSVLELALWAGCSVLLAYSLSITCICLWTWRKWKMSEEDDIEYVNTKPGEFKRPCRV
ncbi:uncharacterized protein LOC115379401 [Myripristis murdjan]|uniref:uncharacterized protein LOC115379401 n=1 Tax=Myripristis murdjan TaxID=586833 RepID=UPI00117634FF|nr:uncharacterized protein LOC115379401 [Myripristis murdjan]